AAETAIRSRLVAPACGSRITESIYSRGLTPDLTATASAGTSDQPGRDRVRDPFGRPAPGRNPPRAMIGLAVKFKHLIKQSYHSIKGLAEATAVAGPPDRKFLIPPRPCGAHGKQSGRTRPRRAVPAPRCRDLTPYTHRMARSAGAVIVTLHG